MPPMYRTCGLSPETIQLLNQSPTAMQQRHSCLCGREVSVEYDWEQWRPTQHVPEPDHRPAGTGFDS